MNKVKFALTLLTVALIAGPILGVVLIYRDNLVGLVLPPDNQATPGLTDSNLSNLNLTALESLQPIQPLSDPTYNQTTGTFSYPLNFTNPLSQTISIDHLSVDVMDVDNNATIGTISIPDPIQVNPGDSAVLNITGNINQQVLNQFETQYGSGNNVNIALENLNVTVGGISLHLDQIPDVGTIQIPG